jgi:predicted DCC family thiol-disulfide oxidoreductase YuxK
MSNSAGMTGQEPAIIVYDGECPFCTRYVTMLRLKAAVGEVRLVDARSDDPAVDRIRDAGLDLDEGMALIQGDEIFHGDDCIHRLALMSTPSTLFNKLNGAIFKSPTASRLLYPLLRCGRNMALMMLGRRKISADSR